MQNTIKLDNYNVKTITGKLFNFYVGSRKVGKRKAEEALRLNLKVIAKIKREL